MYQKYNTRETLLANILLSNPTELLSSKAIVKKLMMTVVTLSMKACSFATKRVAFGHFNGSPLFRNIVVMRALSMPSNKKHFMTRQCWQGATVEVPKIPSTDIQPDKSVLLKGWALKSTKQRKRLPEKQKKYLVDFY